MNLLDLSDTSTANTSITNTYLAIYKKDLSERLTARYIKNPISSTSGGLGGLDAQGNIYIGGSTNGCVYTSCQNAISAGFVTKVKLAK